MAPNATIPKIYGPLPEDRPGIRDDGGMLLLRDTC